MRFKKYGTQLYTYFLDNQNFMYCKNDAERQNAKSSIKVVGLNGHQEGQFKTFNNMFIKNRTEVKRYGVCILK